MFRLEDGTAAIDAWLDRVAGAPGPALPAAEVPDISISPFDLARIGELYAGDLRRFGYELDPALAEIEGRGGVLARVLRGRSGRETL